jgi:hypothetical protein
MMVKCGEGVNPLYLPKRKNILRTFKHCLRTTRGNDIIMRGKRQESESSQKYSRCGHERKDGTQDFPTAIRCKELGRRQRIALVCVMTIAAFVGALDHDCGLVLVQAAFSEKGEGRHFNPRPRTRISSPTVRPTYTRRRDHRPLQECFVAGNHQPSPALSSCEDLPLALLGARGGSSNPPPADAAASGRKFGKIADYEKAGRASSKAKGADEFLQDFEDQMTEMRLELDRELDELTQSARATATEKTKKQNAAAVSKSEKLTLQTNSKNANSSVTPNATNTKSQNTTEREVSGPSVTSIPPDDDDLNTPRTDALSHTKSLSSGEIEIGSEEDIDDPDSYPSDAVDVREDVTSAFLDKDAEHKVQEALDDGIDDSSERNLADATTLEDEEASDADTDNLLDFDEAYDREEKKLFDDETKNGKDLSEEEKSSHREYDVVTNKEELSKALQTQPLSHSRSRGRRAIMMVTVVAISGVGTMLVRELSTWLVAQMFPGASHIELARKGLLLTGALAYFMATLILEHFRRQHQATPPSHN